MVTEVRLVDTTQEVRAAVHEFTQRGYVRDTIFILAHSDGRTKDLAEATETSEIGMVDEGVFNAVANLFRSQGEELRAKMRSLGIRPAEDARLEAELDGGRILLIAWGGNLNFDPLEGDPDIIYSPSADRGNNHIM